MFDLLKDEGQNSTKTLALRLILKVVMG